MLTRDACRRSDSPRLEHDRDDDAIIVQMERNTKPADVLASLNTAAAGGPPLIIVPASRPGR